MSGEKAKDPLDLGGLEPALIASEVDAKKKQKSLNTELGIIKEARLASKEKRLSTPAGSTPSHAPPPPPTVDSSEQKSVMLDKIFAYRERFSELRKRNNVSAKSTLEDIKDELHYCETQLGSKSDGSVGAMALHSAMMALETIHRDVWNPLNLNLNGLANVTKSNMSEFQPILDELMIKYGSNLYMAPEMRLALALSALIMTVHAANSNDPRIATALSKMQNTMQPPASSKDL
ncbi:hypothetical protein [Pleurochrysis sp. endemic virus 2]|nr:hypothetical protein [Pleurochrysis sp. endemic virus 2]|mmetsp:Transcript_37931/g.83503  ORF Transcript_37931/g.83503 Transcript_37931/m.83503 type:complete len:233 (-) Transcript_37931:4410-5108(-)